MAKEKQFALTLFVDTSTREGDGGIKTITYEGSDEKTVLLEILDKHSYGIDEEEIESITVDELMKRINESNGDGCSFIMKMREGRSLRSKKYSKFEDVNLNDLRD